MKITRAQIRNIILKEMAGSMARDSLLSAQLPVDPKVKEAADYLEDGIRSSIEFADHPIEADPEYQINRTLEAVRYELNFTDFMFPGVDLDEVKVELMRRFA